MGDVLLESGSSLLLENGIYDLLLESGFEEPPGAVLVPAPRGTVWTSPVRETVGVPAPRPTTWTAEGGR